MTGRVVELLQTAGHEVVSEDLYAEGFDAAMSREERMTYYRDQYSTQAVTTQVEHLLTAQAIVLVFPTWWFGFPAILKGWFDRVWGPGVAYDHAVDYGPIKPRLHDLRQMLVITSLGAPWWVDRLVLRQPVKRVLKTAIIGACAPKCRLQTVSLYKSESVTESQIAKFERRVKNAVGKW